MNYLRRPKSTLFAVLLVLVASGSALAGTQDGAVVALHQRARPPMNINICPGGPASVDPNTKGIPCSDYSVDSAPILSGRVVYLVVARGNPATGIAQVSCGISLSANVEPLAWYLCADSELPMGGWPSNGGGNVISWDPGSNCQVETIGTDGVHAIAGSFYIYAYGDGLMSVTPNNAQALPEFEVVDCGANVTNLLGPFARVGFENMLGSNPCAQPVPAVMTTWGRMKSRF